MIFLRFFHNSVIFYNGYLRLSIVFYDILRNFYDFFIIGGIL